jgi:uncharacterized membrane protein YuzA (DUF378 family)
MCLVRFFSLLLIIVGALNWGLWGFFQYGLVADIFGGNATGWARFIYALVGLAGLYGISFFFTCTCKIKDKSSCCSKEDTKQ